MKEFQFRLIRNPERLQQSVSGRVEEQDHEAGVITSPSNRTWARGREVHFAQAELHRTIRPRRLPSHLPFASDQASPSLGFLVLLALLGQRSHPLAHIFGPGNH